MGLILDTSVLIAAERGRLNLPGLFARHGSDEVFIAAVTASELLHGVERAETPSRRKARSAWVEAILEEIGIIEFDLAVARRHAALWATLEKAGRMIGAHDLQIAATAMQHGCRLATLNTAEFKRVPSLKLVDTASFVS